MAKTLYNLMDWPEIETIIYSESDDPHALLGPHKTAKGLLVQAFIPAAEKVSLKLKETGKIYLMEMMEEPGFFAVLLPKKTKPDYTYLVTLEADETLEIEDPYRFEPVWEQTDTQKFNCGIHYNIYEKMGAIPMTMDGVEGVLFSVWAPNALRVSVVGEFNHWDGRCHQMRRLWDSGVFELFIPGLGTGCVYKFELKLKGSLMCMKTDPYGRCAESFPGAASIVTNTKEYVWQDEKWMKERTNRNVFTSPMNIYQLHLRDFSEKEDGKYKNYRELAEAVSNYAVRMGYTHVLLMAVNEYGEEEGYGYRTFGYYSPTSRFGTAADFQYFVDFLHQQGIGVLMQWTPIFFEKNDYSLNNFDGTFLYEHKDERQGFHKKRNACIFNYARPEVKNFLISSALFWADVYHMDGLMVTMADAVLYLDYDKRPGEFLPNMYGSNENLDGIEFFKHLNSIFKKKYQDVLLLADDKSGWPGVTGRVEENGLGFDLKFNNGWTEDMFQYMELDPLFRSGSYSDMLMTMIYAYMEKFVLAIDWESVMQRSLYERMPGDSELKAANLRVLYGYMMCHPGKKLMYIEQEPKWEDACSAEPNKAEENVKQFMEYMAACNAFYKRSPALFSMDFEEDGFEWINQISANENIVVFVRKTEKMEETLLVVCNFVPVARENYKIGVPYSGKYKEVFNSDNEVFGGSGIINPRIKTAKEDECDNREYSIRIKVPPLGISVFQYSQGGEKPARSSKKQSSLKNTLREKMKEAENAGDVEKQLKAAAEVAERKRAGRGV
ncbi:MAG: 1,4-alpha-glucan branching protein GlgB [Lachnospiraceae bacterium]|nr:1,4-alpha-glucan branching protein GlgB [Lachnospiraceae bacterium]